MKGIGFAVLLIVVCSSIATAQSQLSAADPQVPPMVNFGGVLTDGNGKPLTGIVGVTFALYTDSQGGAPLWMETQNIYPDETGHYSVMLGSTRSTGIPSGVFAAGEARWLGIQPQGQPEQPRIMLLSVPYALKASDANTLGGKPASAYMLAPESPSSAASTQTNKASTVSDANPNSGRPAGHDISITTANYIPLFLNSSGTLGDSALYQNASGNIGLGYTNPTNARMVIAAPNGGGVLNSSNLVDQDMFVALTPPGATDKHAYFGPSTDTNLTLGVNNTEMMRITNTGNIGIGYKNPTNARVVIAAPNGGGVLNSSNLVDQDMFVKLTAPGATDKYAFFGPSTNTNLVLGVGGVEKMRVTNTGKVGIGTTFPVATLDVNGIINATTGFAVGDYYFDYGSVGLQNAFLGFAGNNTTTGISNIGSGLNALQANSTGSYNTANGAYSLQANTAGFQNTAMGYDSLYTTTSGVQNTAAGAYSLYSNTTGYQNTASGIDALYNNDGGYSNTAVGSSALGSSTEGNQNTASGAQTLSTNTTGSDNTAIGYSSGSTADFSNLTGSNNTFVGYLSEASTGTLSNGTAIGAYAEVGQSNSLVLGSTAFQNGTANVLVGIDVSAPTNILTVLQGGGHAIADGWDTYSSRRWKTNIQTLRGALNKVEHLRGVSYDLRDSGKHEVGVIAEEVGAVVPEVVSWDKTGKDAQGVDYSRLTALLIEATKEQQTLIQRQQEQIRSQQTQIALLTRQVRAIRAALQKNTRTGSDIRTVNTNSLIVHE